MFIDEVHSGVAGAMEETFLVVLMTISLLHVTLFDLQALPQYRILDPLNLRGGQHIFLTPGRAKRLSSRMDEKEVNDFMTNFLLITANKNNNKEICI